MQKTMYNKVYDTNTATLIKKYTFGVYGEPEGYEECLYRTEDGFYFLLVRGGAESPYPQEDLLRIGKAKAENWLKEH